MHWRLIVQSLAMEASYLGHTDVIGVFVGIVGIVLAWVFYVRSKEQVRPCILFERTTLIGKSGRLFPESVEFRYNNRVIPELSKVRITFWNAGKRTLNWSDIAQNDPIAIKFSEPGVQVLDVRSMTATRPVINARASLKDNIVHLSFDFLDKDDGVALEVFYDSGSETETRLFGTVKGARGGIVIRTRKDSGSGSRSFSFFLLCIPAFIVFSIIFTHWKINALDIILATVSGILGIFFLVHGTYRYFRGRIPLALRREYEVVEFPKIDKQSQDLHQAGKSNSQADSPYSSEQPKHGTPTVDGYPHTD